MQADRLNSRISTDPNSSLLTTRDGKSKPEHLVSAPTRSVNAILIKIKINPRQVKSTSDARQNLPTQLTMKLSTCLLLLISISAACELFRRCFDRAYVSVTNTILSFHLLSYGYSWAIHTCTKRKESTLIRCWIMNNILRHLKIIRCIPCHRHANSKAVPKTPTNPTEAEAAIPTTLKSTTMVTVGLLRIAMISATKR